MPKKKQNKKRKYLPQLEWIILIPILALIFSSLYFLSGVIKLPESVKNIVHTGNIIQNTASESTKISLKPTIKPTPNPILTLPQINNTAGIPILTYHYIGNNPNPKDSARDALEIPPDKFEEQMQYLASNGYTPISLDTLYGIFNKQITSPPKPIVLTFDDGYIDFYTNAFPILRRFNFHVVSFIPTGLIGKSYYMSWDQIKEIQSSGLVTFEAHTISHVNLASLSFDDALKEMLDSKNVLQTETGYPVNFIAYPYGISNETVQAAALKAGFAGGLGTLYGKASAPGYNLPRIKISGSWSITEFASRL